MPITNEPFSRLGPESPYKPLLPVRITNPDTQNRLLTYGIISTGAEVCALPARFAPLLGHNLTLGKPAHIYTGNGQTIAYLHRCLIDILDPGPEKNRKDMTLYTIKETPVHFVPNLDQVLLGVNHFLSEFILAIDYTEQIFSIKKPVANISLIERFIQRNYP